MDAFDVKKVHDVAWASNDVIVCVTKTSILWDERDF